MGEIIEFPEDQHDPSRRREDALDILATPPPKIETTPDPGGNAELAAVPAEKRYSLNAALQRIEKGPNTFS